MILTGRKLVKDRQAGISFDWRRRHGAFLRYVFAFSIAALLVGSLFAYVRISLPEKPETVEQGKAVVLMNLDLPQNRWLSQLIEREAPYVEPWPVSDDTRLQAEMDRSLGILTPALYAPELIPVKREEKLVAGSNLAGGLILLPPVEVPVSSSSLVEVEKAAQWWVEFEALGQTWLDFAVPLDQAKGLITEGDTWGFYIGLDARGLVFSCIELEGRDDPQTIDLKEALERAPFPQNTDTRKQRWWKIVGTAVNRNASESNSSGGAQ